ncbi:hypothetical protein [Methylobacterium dankookense]|uniref:Uncharacterized protein n=1 Tax=Methylobacterium dankookense TaxID=560405 RepID=A0A564FT18_9HYPH|nr:hypothetical protein [Methylobacterium dankookense]GJD58551.1 hypothetical protein IFDJLNFL_4472 [Methylobacterium dankookense]VUF10906.1 hypothetical protein MTDSW087_00578 [Methylobacterium dankookense]
MGSPRPWPDAPLTASEAEEAERGLQRLAEICIEAHGIVEREGSPEMRAMLEDLLRRVADQLAERAG